MKKYQIIYADPPWQQKKGGAKKVRPNSSGKAFVYPTITLQEIKQHLFNATLKTTPDSVMFLWTIDKWQPNYRIGVGDDGCSHMGWCFNRCISYHRLDIISD